MFIIAGERPGVRFKVARRCNEKQGNTPLSFRRGAGGEVP